MASRFWICVLLLVTCVTLVLVKSAVVPDAQGPTQNWLNPEEQNSLKKWVGDLMDCRNVPGLTLAVVTTNDTWTTGFGQADIKSGTRVNPRTRFCIASLTKAFTTMALGIILKNSRYVYTLSATSRGRISF